MALHVIKKGLDLPVTGVPEQVIESGTSPRHVAILADDFHGLKPSFRVQPGDVVRRGQALFEDKKTPGVLYTAPCAGTVTAIHRGERRSFQSLVIETVSGGGEQVSFQSYTGKSPAACDRAEVQELLVESGLWIAFRTRPFTRIPQLNAVPYAIFVTAMDTNPLAAEVDIVVGGRVADMEAGLLILGKLTEGKVHFCKKAGSALQPTSASGVTVHEFKGPHPAGTAGLHIHRIAPVGHGRTVWHIGIQDVLAIGRLFRTGELDTERVISLAGPVVKRPRLLKVRLGASVDDLTVNELEEGENRVISGSILSGRKANGDVFGYLGRYHVQVSALKEDRERVFLGWLLPGAEKFSVVSAFVSSLIPDKKFNFTTTTNGGARAMVPIGTYERVMPFDILPTFLLRSLVVDDIEQAEELGCLELDEEDLALCTFVCPSKYDFGPILRRNLNTIEKEG